MRLFKVEVPSELTDKSFWDKVALYQVIYSIAGLILGMVCMLGGIFLFLRGVTGSVSWTANLIGAESSLTNAAPGVILFIVGLFTVLITKFDVAVKQNQDQ